MEKTILITGSTDGIGKLTALKLAQAGHQLYLHGRNQAKLDGVIEAIKSESQNEKIKGFVADFSDMAAVKKMAPEIEKEGNKIDVLINNAGIYKSSITSTPAGFDIRFAVNYLAPYILTPALLPLLKNGTAPRIINLSSAAQAPVSLEALSGKVRLSAQAAYAQSKLALTMWSFHLAKVEPEVQVIAVNPGSLLNTKMVKEAYGQFWAPADKGASILSDLALSADYQNATGKYFDNDQGETKGHFARAHADAYDDAKIAQLLAATEDILD